MGKNPAISKIAIFFDNKIIFVIKKQEKTLIIINVHQSINQSMVMIMINHQIQEIKLIKFFQITTTTTKMIEKAYKGNKKGK